MKKMLAFFGAFNPPTNAHIELAKLAKEQTGSDVVLFMPSKSSYIVDEQKKNFAFNDEERMQMLYNLCVHNQPWMHYRADDIYSLKQPHTYDTLCKLQKLYPNASISLLIGADQMFGMEKNWMHVYQIATEFGIVGLQRFGYDMDALLSQQFWKDIRQFVQIVETPDNTQWVSSTEARAYIQSIKKSNEHLKTIVPEEIYDYLRDEDFI